ncbi:MAG TPA: hypothetical protein VMV72_15165 [Verrucomicrobiae bacterium]|nr:hypothetical protein [Verrucomicrobiae bacterium]
MSQASELPEGCSAGVGLASQAGFEPGGGAKVIGRIRSSATQLPKALHVPPPGNPRWVCPKAAQLDLLYLAWGRRQYGQTPIPVSRHPGWQYVLVNRGNPTLVLHGRQKALSPGDFLVFDPDCASGWTDEADGVSDLLVWIWRTAPRCEGYGPSLAAYRQWTIGTKLWSQLEFLHGLCRQEVEHPDKLTGLALEQLHLAVDIAVARLVRPKRRLSASSVPSGKRATGKTAADRKRP